MPGLEGVIGGAQGGAQGGASGGGREMFSGQEATSYVVSWFEGGGGRNLIIIIVMLILRREEANTKESISLMHEPFVVSVE